MQNSRSIWETHEGSTAPRQRPSRNQTNGLRKNGCDDDEELGGVSEALGSTSIGDEASGDENASRKVTWRVKAQPQFHYTSSEGLYIRGCCMWYFKMRHFLQSCSWLDVGEKKFK